MNRTVLLPAAYLMDHLAGDPEWLPHPVRLMGSVIASGESLLRRPGQSKRVELLSGACLVITVVASSYWIPATGIRLSRRRSCLLGSLAELLLGWTCLAARNLEQEATAVTRALHTGDLTLARMRLARIVGRDTEFLEEPEVCRAVIETVAESTADGILAPLFYMALGGVPWAMAYKAINTLDSMIGHADANYFYFGKAAARLDDAANYLPARICALTLVAAAQLSSQADAKAAWTTWRRDRSNHKSPNAGQPESAMAGALHVALGGDNTYAGERISAQRLGAHYAPPTLDKAVQAIHLASAASVLGLAFGVLLTYSMRRAK